MASYAFVAEPKGSPRRRKWYTTGKRSRTAARSFSLKISNHAAGNTMRRSTVELPTNKNWNGRNIFRTCEKRTRRNNYD